MPKMLSSRRKIGYNKIDILEREVCQMSKHSVRLTICGTECAVGTENNEAYVRSLAAEVQTCMLQLSRQSVRASGTVTAIVAALSFCDDYHKEKEAAEALRQQMQRCLADTAKANQQAREAQQEANRLRQETACLRARLGQEEPDPSARTAQQAPVERETSGVFSRPQPKTEKSGADFLSLFEDKHEKNNET
ncbi:hypothetical protein B6259_00295 [Ruminococcaceae bacterium CPB6]|uniref:Cell division protein ZapA n=1 Tax=Caproicibacterium lactatifermentans TaxID=2666138 RepID=A0A859DMJ4_9FIRM|nr:hypothetical protein B6259_00295 [Ruminococcaceae bacterium CPB6]QKN23058.1 cell division protein ZapA [Caproicibacterium lactatifermentans]